MFNSSNLVNVSWICGKIWYVLQGIIYQLFVSFKVRFNGMQFLAVIDVFNRQLRNWIFFLEYVLGLWLVFKILQQWMCLKHCSPDDALDKSCQIVCTFKVQNPNFTYYKILKLFWLLVNNHIEVFFLEHTLQDFLVLDFLTGMGKWIMFKNESFLV